MAAWATEDESAGRLAASLLAPAQDATLSSSSGSKLSKQRSVTPPGERSSKRSSREVTADDSISMLDPRRFTPTLHANLVSEILALRRDQDEKTRLIESLEGTLHATKEEHDSLQQNFTSMSKESRSLKRQMSLLEGGTSSALGELARERDDAVESITETKKRLEIAQKKIRNHEDDSQRVHELWAKDKDGWDDEKRKYERRIHVAESRLKSILEEVAAYQAAHGGATQGQAVEPEAEDAGRDIDAASVRTMSMTNSLRHSLVTSPGPNQQPGHSLADELGFDDSDQSDADMPESVLSSPQLGHTFSRDGGAHQRNYSIDSAPSNKVRSKQFMNPAALDTLEGVSEEMRLPAPKVTYTETGVQYSPPPSPVLAPAEDAAATRAKSTSGAENGPCEIEANQSRKRIQSHNKSVGVESPCHPMISASAQTIETPLSPPITPKLADGFEEQSTKSAPPTPTMVSSAVQTELPTKPPALTISSPPVPPTPVDIPSISIQPPTSRPTTPHSPRLPPHFKHFGCQVNLSTTVSTTDSGVQTEGIQVDKRLARLPAHLQPSAITSRPNSPAKDASTNGRDFTPAPANAANRQVLRGSITQSFGESPSSPAEAGDDGLDVYLGANNDDGPLSVLEKSPLRRPRRYSSLFAGFDSASSDGADEFGDADVSDSEYRTALSAPRPRSNASRPSKRGSFGTATTSPDQTMHSGRSSAKSYRTDLYNSFGITDNSGVGDKHSRKSSKNCDKASITSSTVGSKQGSAMRKAAMIQSGIASQQTRSRSPSLPDGRNPPFPIPTRESSKRLNYNGYTPSEQSSPSRAGDNEHKRESNNVRRVRSAAALARTQRSGRRGSGSPPPLSVSTEATEGSGLPPLPRNDLTTPRNRDRTGSHYKRHRQKPSTTTEHTLNTLNTDPMSVSQASTTQSSGVVDAIAQTMVGEWMYKYVRRRKSFSVPDSVKDDSGNDRHKRWVWLAPYERSILWSSKQPSSGSALMGKSGRKLTIQSVLDVKDDNPAPKMGGPVFNRSILILTPQRALKFTTVSADRHYLWLTALSFLAHSSQAVPQNIAAPTVPAKQQQQQLAVQQPLPQFEAPTAKVRRPGIRDSIRLAKGKASTGRTGPPSVPSMPSTTSSRIGDVSTLRMPPSAGSGGNPSYHAREISRETAEPPAIPRFNNERKVPSSAHGRKRSNTGGHIPPPLSFRGFSGPVGSPALTDGTYSTADNSIDTVGSDIYQTQASSNTTWGHSQGGSQRTSEASSRPSNFFDAIGTVRMEAFISPLALSQVNDYGEEQERFRKLVRRRSKEIRRRSSRSRQRDSYSSRGGGRGYDDYYDGSRTAGEEEYYRDDVFKGF